MLYNDLNKKITDNLELLDADEEEMFLLISEELKTLEPEINELETSVTLSGEFDMLNAYLEIHPGAGGTESCDWASMLARMYERFCEKEGYKWEIVDEQKGDEAGIKRTEKIH